MTRGAAVVLVLGLARAASAEPSVGERADAALAEGRKLYDIQDWDAAIAKFKEAYLLRPEPASLYNIAQAQRFKRDCANALQGYRTYKRHYPDAKNMATVDKFIVEMETCANSEPPPPPDPRVTPAPEPPATPTPDPPATEPLPIVQPAVPASPAPSSRAWMKWTGLGAGVVGLASAGVGIKFALDGKGYNDELTSTCAVTCTSAQALAIEAEGASANNKAMIFSAVGGALVVGGVILFVLSRAGDEAPPVGVAPTAGGATATLTLDF